MALSDIEVRPAAAAPQHWLALLGKSEAGGRDELPVIEGSLPRGLRGSLFRNGPGLFERGGLRKPHLLDGDGLVQRLSFADGKARYQNAFVRTRKFAAEEAAGRYRFATWSMRRPGGMLANLGGGQLLTQAGVTVYPFNNALYAFDEVSPPYGLDPETLATLGERPLGDAKRNFMIKAHTKFDPVSGEWLLFGVTHGRSMLLHMIVYDANGRLKSHRTVPSPRQVYIHDFFATRDHFVFILHPLWFSPWRYLAGRASFIESLGWRGDDGNLVMLVPRDGGAAISFDAPGAFVWHTLNAYRQGDEIVADFVGYDAPHHFSSREGLLYRVMAGEVAGPKAPGTLRRYRIDLKRHTLREEIVDAGTHEFPMIDPRAAMARHAVGYLAAGGNTLYNTALKRVDYDSGKTQKFDFGETVATGEPVFAAAPGAKRDEGWLIVQCLDGSTGTAFFAIFDAAQIDAGPLARLRLPHHLPISFHGWWKAD